MLCSDIFVALGLINVRFLRRQGLFYCCGDRKLGCRDGRLSRIAVWPVLAPGARLRGQQKLGSGVTAPASSFWLEGFTHTEPLSSGKVRNVRSNDGHLKFDKKH